MLERLHRRWIVAATIGLISASGCEQSGQGNATPPASAAAAAASGATPATSLADVSSTSAPGQFDAVPADAEYAALLSEIVSPEGMVRYELLDESSASARLRGVIEGYAAAAIPADASAAIALRINAYNVNALAMAARARSAPGFTSVNAVPGFFDAQSVIVAGRELTLNGLEDELREHKDPRILFTLARGAKGSPALRAEPYAAERLEQQLNQQCIAWFDDLSKNRVIRTGLVLNELLKWREEDFAVAPYEGIRGFVFKRARSGGVIRDVIRNVPDVEIIYAPFDWSLNQAPPPESDLPANE